MKALVVYESMFGNTRNVAEAIGRGLAPICDATIVTVADADPARVAAADLLVVGGPTHVHGMPRPKSRANAAAMARKPGSSLVLEPNAEGPGVREWLSQLAPNGAKAIAFDTRMTMAPFLTGRASRRITRLLRRRGFAVVAHPASFLVDGSNHLVAGEADRAEAWARDLATKVAYLGAAAG